MVRDNLTRGTRRFNRGIYAWCPAEKRFLFEDEVRQMRLPPFRLVCTKCGNFVHRHVDTTILG